MWPCRKVQPLPGLPAARLALPRLHRLPATGRRTSGMKAYRKRRPREKKVCPRRQVFTASPARPSPAAAGTSRLQPSTSSAGGGLPLLSWRE